jgi:acetyl-CoA C-acetyltransferase
MSPSPRPPQPDHPTFVLDIKDSLVFGRVYAGGKSKPILGGMVETAENLRREFSISREEQDALAVSSHHRAAAAAAAGHFEDEIAPIEVRGRKGSTTVSADEHIRPDSSMEQLAGLKPLMLDQLPDATVTAGNASGQNVLPPSPSSQHRSAHFNSG